MSLYCTHQTMLYPMGVGVGSEIRNKEDGTLGGCAMCKQQQFESCLKRNYTYIYLNRFLSLHG